jgi:hypothetical protein
MEKKTRRSLGKPAAAMAWVLCLWLPAACTTLAETGGRALDGSAFAEKTVGIYRAGGKKDGIELRLVRERKGGGEALAITLGAMPNLRFNGGVPGPDGGFILKSVSFLSPSYAGWNEFTLDLSGTGVFTGGTLRLDLPVEILQISSGKIRHNNSRFTGDEALAALRNRHERIGALTAWMRAQDAPGFKDQESFENHWKPLILPELVPRKKRPRAWIAENAQGNPHWVRAEDVRWNAAYTRSLFPEELWEVRDSGTLLRDWEEAADWIYFSYEWDRIVRSLSGEIHLEKARN